MEIKLSGAGKFTFDCPQGKWGPEDSVMQSSMFAGQEMIVIQKSDDEPDLFELRYLGFSSPSFKGMDEAKLQAPAFAKTVLAKMIKEVDARSSVQVDNGPKTDDSLHEKQSRLHEWRESRGNKQGSDEKPDDASGLILK